MNKASYEGKNFSNSQISRAPEKILFKDLSLDYFEKEIKLEEIKTLKAYQNNILYYYTKTIIGKILSDERFFIPNENGKLPTHKANTLEEVPLRYVTEPDENNPENKDYIIILSGEEYVNWISGNNKLIRSHIRRTLMDYSHYTWPVGRIDNPRMNGEFITGQPFHMIIYWKDKDLQQMTDKQIKAFFKDNPETMAKSINYVEIHIHKWLAEPCLPLSVKKAKNIPLDYPITSYPENFFPDCMEILLEDAKKIIPHNAEKEPLTPSLIGTGGLINCYDLLEYLNLHDRFPGFNDNFITIDIHEYVSFLHRRYINKTKSGERAKKKGKNETIKDILNLIMFCTELAFKKSLYGLRFFPTHFTLDGEKIRIHVLRPNYNKVDSSYEIRDFDYDFILTEFNNKYLNYFKINCEYQESLQAETERIKRAEKREIFIVASQNEKLNEIKQCIQIAKDNNDPELVKTLQKKEKEYRRLYLKQQCKILKENGKSLRDIAQELGISYVTVSNYLKENC